MKEYFQKGFSIVEMLAVVAIFILIASVVIFNFSSFRSNQAIKTAAQEILSSLDKARSNTLSSLSSSQYGVHFESGGIAIFQGASYQSSSSLNEYVNMPSPVSISSISLSGGGSDILFDRLTGGTSQDGTVIFGISGNSKTLTILKSGAFSIN